MHDVRLKWAITGLFFFCVAYFFARCFRHRLIFSFALPLLKLSLYWQMFNCMQMSAPNGWNFFLNYKKIWVERKKNKMLFATFHIWIVTKFKTVYTFAQNCMYRVFVWIIKIDKHTHTETHTDALAYRNWVVDFLTFDCESGRFKAWHTAFERLMSLFVVWICIGM